MTYYVPRCLQYTYYFELVTLLENWVVLTKLNALFAEYETESNTQRQELYICVPLCIIIMDTLITRYIHSINYHDLRHTEGCPSVQQ